MRLHRYKRVAFADELEEKLDAKPDGANDLIVGNKVSRGYLPDTYKGYWDEDTTYYVGDFVQDEADRLYYCVLTNTGEALSDTTYWHSVEGAGAYKITAVTETTDEIYVTLEAV